MAASPAPASSTHRRRRAGHLGVAWAALLALALSCGWALSVPAFWGVDETSAVAYAVAAAGGEWPTIHTPNPVHPFPGLESRLAYDVAFGRPARLDVWTANHPPLYYALAGLPLRAGLATGHAGAGMLAARLATAAVGAAGVLAVGWLASVIAPRRPRVQVTAAMVTALAPTLHHYAGQIYNDAVAFTLGVTALAAAFAALRTGPSAKLLIIGALAGGAGAVTRASALAVAVLATAAFALAGWLHAAGPPAHRLRRCVGAGLFAGGPVLLLGGWALAVNVARYGDPTGAEALFAKFGRIDGPPWWRLLAGPSFAVDQVDRFASELSIGVWWPSPATRIAWAVLVAAAVGTIGAAVVWISRGRRPSPADAGIAVLGGALPVLLLVASARFVSAGGYPHSRYLLPGLAVLAALVALGLDGLPGASRAWPAMSALCALLVANISLWLQFRLEHRGWYQQVAPGVELPQLAPTALAVVVTLALGLPAVWGLVQSLAATSAARGNADRQPSAKSP